MMSDLELKTASVVEHQSALLKLLTEFDRVFAALDGRGLSRVDFFLRKSDNAVIFNEINTLPGFTSISMYPMLVAKHGLDLPELIEALLKSVQYRANDIQ